MDRTLNPRDEKQAIYEIYRACRLCGAGAGYKMPIIQNVVDFDGSGIELRQKIRECVQIEVNHTDRMPPLICELCVDKVNDFYEFLELCKQTNTRTRLRLGLPPQSKARDSRDSESCILGVTEPLNNNTHGDLLKGKSRKVKVKKETPELKIKVESGPPPAARPPPSRESSEERRWTRESRAKRSAPHDPPPPKRTTRQQADPPPTTPPKEIPKPTPPSKPAKVIKKTEEPVEKSKLKRPREKEIKIDTPPPVKKAKITPAQSKPGPKSSKAAQKEPPKPVPKAQPARPASKKDPKPTPPPKTPKGPPKAPETPKINPRADYPRPFYCHICKIQTKSAQGFAQHNTKHYPTFTHPKQACDACEEWFSSTEEALAHHRAHRTLPRPYKCTRCYGYFKLQDAYEDHFGANLCLSEYEVPDVKCWSCWRTFPTNKLIEEHRCAGEDGRPGGKCSKCKRNYALLKNLLKHESTCSHRKKGEVYIDSAVQARLLPMQVRIARCDALLHSSGPIHCSTLTHSFALDSKCKYPYMRNVKSESTKPSNHMVTIDQQVKEEFSNNSHINWDSDNSNNSDNSGGTEDSQTVDTLSTISLKTIFSKKCLGKESTNVKSEGSFDCLSKKIGNIIDNLGIEDTQTSCSYDSDSILDKEITNNDNVSANNDRDSANNDKDSANNDKDSTNNVKDSANIDKDSANDKDSAENDKVSANSDKVSANSDKDSANNDKDSANNDKDSVDRPKSLCSDDIIESLVGDNPDKMDDNYKTLIIRDYPQTSCSYDSDNVLDKNNQKPEKLNVATNDEKSEKKEVEMDTTSENTVSGTGSENDERSIEAKDDPKPSAEIDAVSDDTKTLVENDMASNDDSQSLIENDMAVKDDPKLSMENDMASNESQSLIGNDVPVEDKVMYYEDDKNDADSKNDKSNCQNDDNEQSSDSISINEDTSKVFVSKDLEVSSETYSNRLTNEDVQKNYDVANYNQLKQDHFEDKLGNNDCIKTNDTEKMDVDQNDTVDKENHNETKDFGETYENDDFSKINEITNKILKENETLTNEDEKYSHNNESHEKSDHSDSISLNSIKSGEANGVQIQDKFNVNDLSDDDRKLMAELDAQIGENDHRIEENDQKIRENDLKIQENDHKISENVQIKEHLMDNLLKKQDADLRSLDLDSISDDEFNFDA